MIYNYQHAAFGWLLGVNAEITWINTERQDITYPLRLLLKVPKWESHVHPSMRTALSWELAKATYTFQALSLNISAIQRRIQRNNNEMAWLIKRLPYIMFFPHLLHLAVLLPAIKAIIRLSVGYCLDQAFYSRTTNSSHLYYVWVEHYIFMPTPYQNNCHSLDGAWSWVKYE